ncbi:hypothetical protein V5O48_015514 [Marasmius crinis-equi]|uniref:F-box domain-containing protein n=1 Tax=Marasmius crinis-equi TaxID=585013 RepID=A0ABR3EUB1_9AGAR
MARHHYRKLKFKFSGDKSGIKDTRWRTIRDSMNGANHLMYCARGGSSRLWALVKNLPGDILLEILYFMDPKSLLSLASSCQVFGEILLGTSATSQNVWRTARRNVSLREPMSGVTEKDWICLLGAKGCCEICTGKTPGKLDLCHKIWICDYCFFTYKQYLSLFKIAEYVLTRLKHFRWPPSCHEIPRGRIGHAGGSLCQKQKVHGNVTFKVLLLPSSRCQDNAVPNAGSYGAGKTDIHGKEEEAIQDVQ